MIRRRQAENEMSAGRHQKKKKGRKELKRKGWGEKRRAILSLKGVGRGA